MICPKCQAGKTKVLDTRRIEDAVWRMRECPACKVRFTTVEKKLQYVVKMLAERS